MVFYRVFLVLVGVDLDVVLVVAIGGCVDIVIEDGSFGAKLTFE